MDFIKIQRGKSLFPTTLNNLDKYDSVLEHERMGEIIYRSDLVNTDPTLTAQEPGKMLKPGEYYGICAPKKWGEKAIWIFTKDCDIDKIIKLADVPEKCFILPLANGKTGSYLLIHKGGYKQDYSLLCISVHPDDWTKYLPLIKVDDKYLIQLV
jgi:hypothetical protein